MSSPPSSPTSSSNTATTGPTSYQHAANDNKTSTTHETALNGMALELDMDQAVDLLGMGVFQQRLLWAAGLCFAADSMEILLLAFLSIVLRQAWELTDSQAASITSAVFLGATIGTLVLGRLGDVYGRRPIFTTTAVLISIFGVLTAAATNLTTLIIVRMGVGLGVGGLTVPFDTLAEYMPTSHRGTNLLSIEYFWVAGSLVVPACAYYTLGETQDDLHSNWRLFVLLCAVPCVISTALGWLVVPESPRWLVSQGRHQEALTVLREAAELNGLDGFQEYPMGTQLVDRHQEQEAETTVADLLSPKWRRTTLLLWAAWAGFAFLYYGAIMAITVVFSEDNSAANVDGDSYNFDYTAIFVAGSAELAGVTLVIGMIDSWGRIRTQTYSYLGGGLAILLLCWTAQDWPSGRWFHIGSAFVARLCFMGATCTTWVSTAELLTTDIRSTGHALANAVARLGGAASPFLISSDAMSLKAIGSVLCATALATAAVTAALPETAHQKLGAAVPLPELSDSHNNVNNNNTDTKTPSSQTGSSTNYGII